MISIGISNALSFSPKSKVEKSGVRGLSFAPLPNGNGAFIAHFAPDLLEHVTSAKVQQFFLLGIQIRSPMVIDIHRETLTVIQEAEPESTNQKQIHPCRAGGDGPDDDSLYSLDFLLLSGHCAFRENLSDCFTIYNKYVVNRAFPSQDWGDVERVPIRQHGKLNLHQAEMLLLHHNPDI